MITLIGYRGTGKTSVAAALARLLRWDMLDLDDEIERRAGKSISGIFAEDGEPRFRQLEKEVLLESLGRNQLVLSSGGGTLVDPDSRRLVMAAGPVVWLQARPETIADRLRNDPLTASRRPSLSGDDPCNEIALMLSRREPVYGEAASISILTDGLTINGVVDEIVRHLPPLDEGSP